MCPEIAAAFASSDQHLQAREIASKVTTAQHPSKSSALGFTITLLGVCTALNDGKHLWHSGTLSLPDAFGDISQASFSRAVLQSLALLSGMSRLVLTLSQDCGDQEHSGLPKIKRNSSCVPPGYAWNLFLCRFQLVSLVLSKLWFLNPCTCFCTLVAWTYSGWTLLKQRTLDYSGIYFT